MAGQAPAAVVCACVLTGHRAENEAWHADMLSCVERPRGDGDRSTIAVAPGLCGRRLGFTFSSAVRGKCDGRARLENYPTVERPRLPSAACGKM
jgi:hypothetical protein